MVVVELRVQFQVARWGDQVHDKLVGRHWRGCGSDVRPLIFERLDDDRGGASRPKRFDNEI